MPAYNFKKQFVDAVTSGQKLCTIRRNAPKVGDTAYLYTGMRTKACRKLGEGVITKVTAFALKDCSNRGVDIRISLGEEWLTWDERVALSKKDGFESLDDFIHFFMKTYQGNFDGFLIEWELKA